MWKYLIFASVLAVSLREVHADDAKKVEVLHWWTSGGEAAALSVLREAMSNGGYAWKDVPLAGGGGGAAMTALKTMVAAGRNPTASQMFGFMVLDYGSAGKLADLSKVAKEGNWSGVIPKSLQQFVVYDGKQVAVPINVHSENWLWINKPVFDKIGGTQPKTFDDFIALLDKAKAAGVIPLALGGQAWQEAMIFDSIVLSTGGPEFYKKAFNDLDNKTLKSNMMKKAFDNLGRLKPYVDANFSGRDWNLATAMVIKGDALVQVAGDWAKGEFNAANKTPDADFLCYRFPGTDGSVIYHSDIFAMFTVPNEYKVAQAALAQAIMSKEVQSNFNVRKGSVPARIDVSDKDFDVCGKKGIADLKAANERGTLLGSLAEGYGAPPAITNAYMDVVSKFMHGQIATSDKAVTELVQAIDDAR